MESQEDKINLIKARRIRANEKKREDDLRGTYGKEIALAVSIALGVDIALQDFDPTRQAPFDFKWASEIDQSPGLVSAYIDRPEAERLLSCMGRRMQESQSQIGFHDKSYLGLAKIPCIDLMGALNLSENLEEAVLIYPSDRGAILVDCYRTPNARLFSVVVQGEPLISTLAHCFEEARRIRPS